MSAAVGLPQARPDEPGQQRFVSHGLNTRGRDFAVGDIHGAFDALHIALDHIGFDSATDRLFSTGDLVDRGPQSGDVVSWLDKPWFHAVAGNHEMLTWRAAAGLPYPGVVHADHGGEWLATLPPDLQRAIAARLKALPIVLEVATPTGTVGIVHADCPFDDWNEMRAVAWDAVGDLDELLTISLWSFARYARTYIAPVRNIRALVHGHVTVSDATLLGNVHFIDTGGWRHPGRFAFLDLHTLQTHYGPGERFCRPSRRSM